MSRCIILLLTAMCVAMTALHAQEVAWNVDMNAVFQNREGGDAMRPDQTFLFTRLAPEVGLSLDDGAHKVMGGVAWYQPMADRCEGHKIVPTLYYKYEKGPWTAVLGMLPRTLMERDVPTLLWNDSLNFTTPNARGALLRHKGKRSHTQLLLDWRQMQSSTRREAFYVLFDTHYTIAGPLAIDTWLQINHLALTRDAGEDQCVNDDITLMPMLSMDFARYTPSMSALSLSAGAAMQLQRARDMHKWYTPGRFVARAHARWRWLEASEDFSIGKDAFPLYDRYGGELNLGDPYYRSRMYSRTDLRAHIVNNRFMDLSAVLTYHATDKITGFWQQLSCRIYIDDNLWRHRNNKSNNTRLEPTF